MNKVCLDQERVADLIELLINHNIPDHINVRPFIDREEALSLLRCSPGTLQKLRDEDQIEFYAITNKLIIYNNSSIINYVESKSNLT